MSDKDIQISEPLDTINSAKRTAEEMLAEMLDGEKVGARKLTFVEKCGAFAALYEGARNQVVARAFGISIQATSKLSGCLENDPDPYRSELTGDGEATRILMDHNRNRKASRVRHYEEIGREFEALGREEFRRRYYTERVHKRIMLAKIEMARERTPDGARKKI
jgi:hypothetical protein